jgi:hypothetical protein
MLDISDDGGRTFIPHGSETLGRTGDRVKTIRFTQLGSSADRVYRCSVSDPVDITVLATVLEVKGGLLRGNP